MGRHIGPDPVGRAMGINKMSDGTPEADYDVSPFWSENLWIRGDMRGRNVLVHEGVLSRVIDWGDVTSGDLATDLASVLMLLPG